VFTAEERTRVRERLLELAREDRRVVAAAITGSFALGQEDRWSDVDLAFGIEDGVRVEDALEDWTAAVERELGLVHRFDLRVGPSIYRVHLLPSGLQVDLAFTPASELTAVGPAWRTVFGAANSRELPAAPPLDERVGMTWLYVLHARSSIERGRALQAEHFLGELRSRVLQLSCVRLGLRWHHGRGFHELPPDASAWVAESLARSLEPEELRRALGVAVEAFLAELGESAPELHGRLAPILRLNPPV
jgi:predicted nucleotidyltransferase